jgi:hypothetical protein
VFIAPAWSELTAARECTMQQKLECHASSGRRSPLDHQLVDFAQLREIVRRNTPGLRERHALGCTFRRHALVRWLYPAAALLFGALAVDGLVQGTRFAAVVGSGLFVVAVVPYGREIRAIEVGATTLMLKAPFRSRNVEWREVSGGELIDHPTDKGPLPTVRIHRRAEKPIDLNMIAEGTIPLCDAVEAAWRRTTS